MHVFRPHLRICGDACDGVIDLAQKVTGRLFAALEVPIDSEIELRSSFGVELDFSYAGH